VKHDNFDERLSDALRDAYPRATYPSTAIRAHIRNSMGHTHRRRSLVRTILSIAAVLTVFVGGVEYGRRIASVPRQPEPPLPIALQSVGSEWVARLAEFTERAPDMTPAERSAGRQAALAALFAATVELLQESQDDELLSAAARLLQTRRQSLREAVAPSAISF